MDVQDVMALPRLRCGDSVHHRPSGEDWVVAFADYASGELAPAGWPDSRANISDCDIVERCDDEKHARWVKEWAESKSHDNRRSRVLRLYGNAVPAQAAAALVAPDVEAAAPDYSSIEKRIIDGAMTATGREHVAFGNRTYAGVVRDRNACRRALITNARMLACWGPECFPADHNGQVHFARALMESAAKEMADAAGVPYPVEDAEPAANPVAGAIKLLEQIEHTLTTLNGVYAIDTETTSEHHTTMRWTVDVMPELEGVTKLLAGLRGMPV